VPFAASWRPAAVALGVVAVYLLAAVILTSALARHLPRRWWRRIHLASHPLFWLATLHALMAGTDAATPAMTVAASGAAGLVLALTFFSATGSRPAATAAAPETSADRGFHPLTVSQVRRESPDAVSVAFDVPPGLAPVYRFEPGQHVTLRVRIDGVDHHRCYSICSSLADGELRIAIKRVPGGRVSTWANTVLRAGDVIDVAPPAGRFTAEPNPLHRRHVLGVAVGSGITPVISILASVLAGEPGSRCTLVYGNRRRTDIIFRNRLAELVERHGSRLRVLHILSGEPTGQALLSGRITGAKIRELTCWAFRPADIDQAYLCGPPPMIEQTRRALIALGMNASRVQSEHFTPPLPRTPNRRPTGRARPVTIVYAGMANTVAVHPGETVLDAALRSGLDLPHSCRAGICGSCQAHTTDQADPVLACQLTSFRDGAVLDFDAKQAAGLLAPGGRAGRV
jgi:ferredoxin-NADP reductase